MPLVLHRRLPAAACLLLACIAGPTFRAVTDGTIAKIGGDVLYAVGVYALVLLIRPRTTVPVAALVAAALCWSVEFAQLTPFPADASRHSTLSRLVLGSTFHPADLASYLIGVLLAAAVTAIPNCRRPSPSEPHAQPSPLMPSQHP